MQRYQPHQVLQFYSVSQEKSSQPKQLGELIILMSWVTRPRMPTKYTANDIVN